MSNVDPTIQKILEAHGAPKPVDPRDPDHSRPGVFAYHNCWKCDDGRKPCVAGNPRNCGNLHARND